MNMRAGSGWGLFFGFIFGFLIGRYGVQIVNLMTKWADWLVASI